MRQARFHLLLSLAAVAASIPALADIPGHLYTDSGDPYQGYAEIYLCPQGKPEYKQICNLKDSDNGEFILKTDYKLYNGLVVKVKYGPQGLWLDRPVPTSPSANAMLDFHLDASVRGGGTVETPDVGASPLPGGMPGGGGAPW